MKQLDLLSTKTHAYLDYAGMAAQAAASRLPGLQGGAGCAHKAVLTAISGYTLASDYPGGIYKRLPMKTHLMLDAIAGAGFLGAAVVRRRDRAASYTLAGLGLLYLASALSTRTSEHGSRRSSQAGRASRGDSPIRRYARERLPETTTVTASSSQNWPGWRPSHAPMSAR